MPSLFLSYHITLWVEIPPLLIIEIIDINLYLLVSKLIHLLCRSADVNYARIVTIV